jgi:uncharacterized ion transporter superfamily protein YfcC
MNEKKKFKFKLPDTYIIVFGLILIMLVLSLALPSGEYNTVTSSGGTEVVDPNSFHYVTKPSFGFDDFINSLLEGFSKNALLILGSFCTCGFFYFIIGTGAMDRSFNSLAKKLHGKEMLLIPLATFIFCCTGTTGMLQIETIALLPVTITIARILELDPMVAVAIIYCGTYSGYATSAYSPANTMLAQQIADITPLSGFAYRAIWWVISTIVTCWYVLRYARRVKKDPANSLLPANLHYTKESGEDEDTIGSVSKKDLIILLLTVAGFVWFIYKAMTKGYGINYIVGVFLIVVVLIAIITKTSADETIHQCIEGAKNFTYGGLLMGFAGTIAVIMTQCGVLDTIVHGLSVPLSHFPKTISGVLMYFVNLIINFCIPSTSGKAPMVMPLMAPLADVVGLSRQISVSAYVLADAIGNTIIPTHAVLIAMISMAGVNFKDWFKFQFPLFLIWSGLALAQIVVATMIGFA